MANTFCNLLDKMFKWLKNWLWEETKYIIPLPIPVERNYMDDVTTLRDKLKNSGWSVREFPVRSNDIVKSWKIIASKGQKSITIGGATLDEALLNLAKAVGVVSRTARV